MQPFTMYVPILVIVGGNVLYHLAAKALPTDQNPFVPLVAAYALASVLSLVLFFITSPDKHLSTAVSQMDKLAVFLAVAMVAMEVGTVLMFRVGWDVSVGPLIAHVTLAVTLLAIGIFCYHEHPSLIQALGVACCLIGVLLINKK